MASSGEVMMLYVVVGLTVLFIVSYSVYRTAKTEKVGFNALVAWVSFAGLIIAALIAWIFLSILV
jgi:hypothetical protein